MEKCGYQEEKRAIGTKNREGVFRYFDRLRLRVCIVVSRI